MTQLVKLLIAVLISVWGVASLAAQPAATAVQNESYRAADGTRVMQLSLILPANPERLWWALTTSEGFRTWAAPVAFVDFKLGGFIESSYNAKAQQGDASNIRNEIMAFVPLRMLAIRNRQAPPNALFDAATFQKMHTVILLDVVDDQHTRMTLTQPGFENDALFDGVYKHFEAGNRWTLQQLHKSLGAKAP